MTDIALREYLESLIRSLEQRCLLQFRMGDEAITKAERTMNARLESMNEFRDALKDQAGRMATKDELTQIHKQVEELQRNKANLDGRIAVTIAVAAIVGSLVLWGLTKAFP